MKVWWRSGHLPGRRGDLRKSLQTDRQTDGRTDDGRRAIALAHSWNELKTLTLLVCESFDERLALLPPRPLHKARYIMAVSLCASFRHCQGRP